MFRIKKSALKEGLLGSSADNISVLFVGCETGFLY
jgi:hypothetical protein